MAVFCRINMSTPDHNNIVYHTAFIEKKESSFLVPLLGTLIVALWASGCPSINKTSDSDSDSDSPL